MPTKRRREDTIIERFLSGYENGSWSGANIDWPDKRTDRGVDAIATRSSDGRKLALEHTIIEPFVDEKRDFAFFRDTFLSIENDTSLPVPEQWIRVFVPVETLRDRERGVRDAIVNAVHGWLKANRLSLRDGDAEHRCAVTGVPGKPTFDIKLRIKVVPLGGGAGKFHVRRLQINDTLQKAVAKALKNKLPKLLKTEADKRILLLERQHMNLLPESILDEIEKQKSSFPGLAQLDEIWIVETVFYETDGYLRFEHYNNGILVRSLDFLGAQLWSRSEEGRAIVVGEKPLPPEPIQ